MVFSCPFGFSLCLCQVQNGYTHTKSTATFGVKLLLPLPGPFHALTLLGYEGTGDAGCMSSENGFVLKRVCLEILWMGKKG